MNIVRVSSKECILKFSLNDPNIKIKTGCINGRELNKNDLSRLDRDIYVEWRMQPPEYSNFFTSLLYCAKNGLFEKESVEYFKSILDIQEQISIKQNFLREKFINNITDLLNEINDGYMQKEDGFPSSNGQEVAYLFSSRVTSNGEKIILSMIFDEKENNLLGFSIFFYSKKENFHKNNEIRLPLDATLAIVWLNMCKLFLYASKETYGAMIAKLEEIKLIVDEIEKQRNFIKESFAFNNEPDIKKDIEVENTYTIIPSKDDKKILINAIENHDIFNQYNLAFEHCIFGDTISIAMNFTKEIRFSYCIFNQIVSFKDSKFHEKASFEHVIFEDEITFTSAQFHKGAYFTGSTFLKKSLFMETIFDDNAYFDNTIFKDEVSFQIGEFHKNAYFYGTTFQKFPFFIQAIFSEDINFTNTELNIEFDEVRDKIKSIYEARLIENKKQGKEKPQAYKIANEFRDTFRTIKSALIKGNNMLDASNYHRTELYCKELELEYKREEKAKNFWEKCKFPLSNGKDFIDEIQLYCYRLTSDHHTNLLMILNNVIFLIALFGLAKCAIENKYVNASETLISVMFAVISISFFLRLKFTLGETCCKCSTFIKSNFAVILFYCIPAVLAGYILFNYCASSCPLYIASAIFILYSLSYDEIMGKMALLCDITKKKIILLFMYLMPKARTCIVIAAYAIITCMIFTTPSSILPILGKLIENKSAEVCLFVVGNVKLLCYGGNSFASETLNLIYMLFLFLLLWSLQKTARKNTIVPS